MVAYLNVTSAMASILILAGCATGGSAAVARNPNTNPNPACLTQTGSRIAANGKDCSLVGQSYTGEDITRTGTTQVGDALRLLDPIVTVNH
jgi:hypothetical protein